MKIVELKLSNKKKGEGITAISLVKHPAIEENWIAFSAEGLTVDTEEVYTFKTIDEEQRIVAGPAMIPDKLIFRKDEETGEESFVFFKRDTIRDLSERFLLQGKQGSMTIEHTATLNELSVVESWIVEDPERDKSSVYGFSLPVGSWFVKIKVLNDDIWSLVKEKSVEGFSVEGVFAKEIIKQSKEMTTKKFNLESHLEKIRDAFKSEKPTEEAEEFATVDVTDAGGAALTLNYPGEVIEVGTAITLTVEGEEVPVPVGEYLLPDGKALIVTEEGIAGEIKEVVEEDLAEEGGEGLKDEQIDQLVSGIAEIIANFQTQVGEDIATAIAENAEALRLEFNREAEEVEPVVPGATKDKIVKGLNKFVHDKKA